MDFYIQKRNYSEALRVRDLIEFDSLNMADKLSFTKNSLKLDYNTEKSNLTENQKNFQAVLEKFGYNKEFSLQVHLDYLKYLEDIREVKLPKRIIERIEKDFEIKNANDPSRAYYLYLKGRQSYGSGYFIEALNYLSESMNLYKKLEMEEEVGNVLNTAVNCFNDNLYFEEAGILAEKVLEIRKKYNSALIGDTYGVLGGIKFKKGDFEKALEHYKESCEILSQNSENNLRTFNYIAKCYIFLKDYDNAKQYLEKSEKLFDIATEKDKSFTHLYKLILAFMKNDSESFRETSLIFQDPKNYFDFDNFPLGWAYTFIAMNSYHKGEIEKGHNQLAQAIKFFMEERYYFEAGYVWLYNLINEPLDYIGKPFEEDPLTIPKFLDYIELHSKLTENFAFFKEKHEDTSNIVKFRDDFLKISSLKNKEDQKKSINELLKKVWLF
jgi:tetratricopeptide (TPR) repeat protein